MTLKLVILDGYTLNPGDLDWGNLQKLGDCTFYDRTPNELVLERAKDAEIILTNKTQLSKETILQLPKLQYIGVMATGYNVVDIEAAHQNNIIVTNVPAYSTQSVVQLTFALILELTNHVGQHSDGVSQGRWVGSKDFSYWDFPLIELQNLTLGIMGYGHIGKKVAEIAKAFGMHIICFTRTPKEDPNFPYVQFVEKDTLFKESDIITLHCPLTKATQQCLGEQELSLMKKSAFLINTSRGPLIDEAALAKALNQGQIAGAGLDVLSQEPPKENNPLLTAKNCFITPHIGWATRASRERLLNIIIQNIQNFLSGHPKNTV